MITGTHLLLYSENPEADRVFFRDVLGLPSVDAGEGWLIFALPPAELGVHPTDGTSHKPPHGGRPLLAAVLYLMCSDLPAYMKVLEAKKVWCSPVEEEPWGNKNHVPATQRWRDRALSTDASDGSAPGYRVEMVRLTSVVTIYPSLANPAKFCKNKRLSHPRRN